MNSIIDRIKRPEDIKKLSIEDMDVLSQEIREFLI